MSGCPLEMRWELEFELEMERSLAMGLGWQFHLVSEYMWA